MLRQFLSSGVSVTLVLVLGCVTAGAQETAPSPAHCHLIQSDELQAIVGDCARNGVGGPQYCGLWSLTSKQRQFNCFGNSYAGLLPGELRGRTTTVLQVVDDKTAVLFKPVTEEDGTEAKATYRFIGPNCLEHTLVIKDSRSRIPSAGYREVSWCSYMNCPDDPRLHFLSNGQMTAYLSPEHGVGSRVAPSYVPEEQLEKLPPQDENHRPFHIHWATVKFDEPFYYGRLGAMVLLYVFDNPQDLRFFCSPSGGGGSLLPQQTCPAWDFLWIIPAEKYEVGKEYTFRLRLVYKPYLSDEDLLAEVAQARKEMEAQPSTGE
jgi:hypothetical protein